MNTQRKTCHGKTRAERIAQYAQQDAQAREQQTLNALRAELRAIVDAEELNAKPHGIYARRNGCTTLLGRHSNFNAALQAIRAIWNDTVDRDALSGFNDELGRYTFTNEHGTMWIYVAPCE